MQSVIAVGEQDFLEQVIARSAKVPVLVDFWAPWCGPCRTLGPLLEKLAEDSKGRFVLAKVDTDQDPALAQRHQIRGIPAVKLYRDGQIVAEFTGALPAADVRAFLDKHIPDDSIAATRRAAELILAADFEGADAALAGNTAETPFALAVRARVALLRGRIDEARKLADAIPATADERELGDAVSALYAVADEARVIGIAALEARVEKNARDAEAHYLLAGAHLIAGRLLSALEALLVVVRLDRKFREDAGRKMLLALFSVAGIRSETSDAYRRKLADLL